MAKYINENLEISSDSDESGKKKKFSLINAEKNITRM